MVGSLRPVGGGCQPQPIAACPQGMQHLHGNRTKRYPLRNQLIEYAIAQADVRLERDVRVLLRPVKPDIVQIHACAVQDGILHIRHIHFFPRRQPRAAEHPLGIVQGAVLVKYHTPDRGTLPYGHLHGQSGLRSPSAMWYFW